MYFCLIILYLRWCLNHFLWSSLLSYQISYLWRYMLLWSPRQLQLILLQLHFGVSIILATCMCISVWMIYLSLYITRVMFLHFCVKISQIICNEYCCVLSLSETYQGLWFYWHAFEKCNENYKKMAVLYYLMKWLNCLLFFCSGEI